MKKRGSTEQEGERRDDENGEERRAEGRDLGNGDSEGGMGDSDRGREIPVE